MARKSKIAKAGSTASKPPEDGNIARLDEMEVQLVSLVHAGANRQRKFFVVKSAIVKNVPAADAALEEKQAARAERSTTYGVQVLESPDTNLNFPADSATDEAMYGDPVNLTFSFSGPDNQPDEARVRAAIPAFKAKASSYSDEASRGLVYARIIVAALAMGITVTLDPNDAVDNLLPQSIKDKITAPAGATPNAEGTEEPPAAAKADLAAWLEERQARVVEMALAIAGPLADPVPPQDVPAVEVAPPAQIDKSGEAPAETKGPEVALLRKELVTLQEQHTREQHQLRAEIESIRKDKDKAIGEAQAARAQVAAIRKGMVGGSSVIPTGEVSRNQNQTANTEEAAPEAVLCGDVAANIARQARALPTA